jgi:signal transduction histidine kinase
MRQRFAADVADGPGKSLDRCLAALDGALTVTPASLAADVAAARAAGQAAEEELARTAAGDIGRLLVRGGLAAALIDLASSAGAEADVRIDCEIDGGLAAAAWFAASEAVANALKHAGPARIWLSAVTEDNYLLLQVADDGAGGADPHGHGLRGLAERLARHGVVLHVLGEERGGTRVLAEFPLNGRQHASATPRPAEAQDRTAPVPSANRGGSAGAKLGSRVTAVAREPSEPGS